MSDEEDDLGLESMFPEPPRPPTPEAKTAVYVREKEIVDTDNDWKQISLRLVGSHSLWGHYLWNAALALATFLDENRSLYQNKRVLELGAGGALPSIVAAKNGAAKVVITDYPDAALVENIRHNVIENISDEQRQGVAVEGYIWGRPTEALLAHLPSIPDPPKFDLVILSDLIFNHSQHEAMLFTCENVLSERKQGTDPCALVFFTHHRPQFAERDLGFFDLATKRGWTCEDVFTRKFPPMFAEDPGDEQVRSTVHGYVLRRL